jgi:hypothetical protein
MIEIGLSWQNELMSLRRSNVGKKPPMYCWLSHPFVLFSLGAFHDMQRLQRPDTGWTMKAMKNTRYNHLVGCNIML